MGKGKGIVAILEEFEKLYDLQEDIGAATDTALKVQRELRCQFTKYIQFRYTSHSSHDGARLRWWKLRMCNSAKGSEEFF